MLFCYNGFFSDQWRLRSTPTSFGPTTLFDAIQSCGFGFGLWTATHLPNHLMSGRGSGRIWVGGIHRALHVCAIFYLLLYVCTIAVATSTVQTWSIGFTIFQRTAPWCKLWSSRSSLCFWYHPELNNMTTMNKENMVKITTKIICIMTMQWNNKKRKALPGEFYTWSLLKCSQCKITRHS